MKKLLKIGSQFTGVGAFEQSLDRLGIKYENIYAAEWDKYARKTYLANFSKPKFYIKDVHDTPINDIDQLDIAMFSPPCQGFSLAGKRGGSILFLNSHQFIQQNKPRYFIFENVKGLLSHDKRDKKAQYGNTFNEWINYLGGKSVNGNPVIFPHQESVPYHIYHKVINAKNCGVPQNRERVFIIGIRDDDDNNFTWPKDIHLTKRLKDVLEENVDEKYYLSDKMINYLLGAPRSLPFTNPSEKQISNCILANQHKMSTDQEFFKIGAIRGRNPEEPTSREAGLPTKQMLEINQNGTSNALTTVQKDNVVIQLNSSKESAGQQPYKQNRVYDAKGISPVLDTECGRPSIHTNYRIRRLTPRECFRLMDFPDTFKMPCSDTQMYKQAGNSIVVACLTGILKKLF